tara:strand:+ start:7079 stop:8017 length:939 start_codon:yes stop_codon:yes gene_type:complete
MNFEPILLVAGEPKSIFFEIFFKSLKFNKYNSPIILICSKKLLKIYMVKNKIKKNIKLINYNTFKNAKLSNKFINIIDIEYIQKNHNDYIKKCFDVAFNLIKKKITTKIINGPISKTKFLNGKFPGITEYISNKFNLKDNAMLIYNKNLSVCPITTHLPIKKVAKNISKQKIKKKIILISKFYREKFNINPKIAVLGLNPHCESFDKFDEDKKIIKPAINSLKKNIKVSGPYSPDTIFLRKNREKFNVIVGMYHDQVLSPLKTLYEHDAINITLGLPFLRISPDHGPNERMIGKNLSNPLSLIQAIRFLDKN